MKVLHRFFIIITPSQNHNTLLMLPRFFINDWRHQLGDTVQVTAYDGIIVTIRLERDDGRIYFADGWKQFFDHHNLQDAHVLIFEYNGNSTFNMTIFDHSRLEVTYESDVPEEYNVSHTDNPAFGITLTPHHNSHRKIKMRLGKKYGKLRVAINLKGIQGANSSFYKSPKLCFPRSSGSLGSG
ncbi:B3 domain-containing protein At4g01580-like [Olea europaea var. sylvestris]|uniref:B3 domain-containing protein At4g01580-like n=1 Tax=Olea europaea var. sylvestris TaxID=158386 RepID=UPI000C1D013A|nr:B3 domain-containing protein At4g01580-like [Olea europaea var. sylvestris]